MKKILILLAAIFSFALNANAESMTAVALTDFSTEKPKDYFVLKINEGFTIDGYQHYSENTVFYGKVIKVSNGKIGKRNGYLIFTPTHYYLNENVSELEKIPINIKVSYYKPFDKEKALKNLANTGLTMTASIVFHIPALSEGISFIKGAVNPEEDTNRIMSGIKQVYKDSPLSYTEKGEPFIIQPGQEVKINISEN